MSAPNWIQGVAIGPELCAQLEAVLNGCSTVPSSNELRSRVRGIDPDVDHLLVMIRQGALAWRTSVDGSNPRKSTEVIPESFTAAQAARQIHITPHAVRLAIREHRLGATKDENGHLHISPSAIELFKKRTTA